MIIYNLWIANLHQINLFMEENNDRMNFFCVYVKTRKKFDKYLKLNKIKNKYIIDIKKIVEEDGMISNVKVGNNYNEMHVLNI